MQQINLYQEQFRTRRDPLDARHLGAGLVVLLIVLAAASVWLHQRAGDAAERAAAAERERDRLERRVLELRSRLEQRQAAASGAVDEATRLRAELAAKRRVLEYLESGPIARRDGFSGHLQGLARRVVDDVWFDRIAFERGGETLRLEGHALRADDVPRMIAALGEEAAYAGRAFRTLVIERPENADWRVDFVLASDPPDAAGEKKR